MTDNRFQNHSQYRTDLRTRRSSHAWYSILKYRKADNQYIHFLHEMILCVAIQEGTGTISMTGSAYLLNFCFVLPLEMERKNSQRNLLFLAHVLSHCQNFSSRINSRVFSFFAISVLLLLVISRETSHFNFYVSFILNNVVYFSFLSVTTVGDADVIPPPIPYSTH